VTASLATPTLSLRLARVGKRQTLATIEAALRDAIERSETHAAAGATLPISETIDDLIRYVRTARAVVVKPDPPRLEAQESPRPAPPRSVVVTGARSVAQASAAPASVATLIRRPTLDRAAVAQGARAVALATELQLLPDKS
jgi:hypothetical protein